MSLETQEPIPTTDEVRSFEFSRRRLLKLLGGGILIAALAPDALAEALTQRRGPDMPKVVSAWVHIGADGRVTVFTGKVEVGQNARTSLTQAAAEELRVSPDVIQVTMGDTDLVPFDMGTFGSMTTPRMVPLVRGAAATAREALLELAAKKWAVDIKTLRAAGGMVIGAAGSATYGELAQGQPIDKQIDASVALTPATDWQVLGKSIPKVGARDFVTGRHTYASDISLPGMLYAKLLRPPSFGAKLTSVDTSKADAMPGVKVVHQDDFVAVAAPTSHLAQAALTAIHAEWNPVPQSSSQEVFKLLRGTEPLPPRSTTEGIVALADQYTAAYIAHVPLEPRAAVAEWDGKKMTVHTGTQRPFGVKPEVAAALGLPESQIRVIVPDTGSGYGGKHTGDAAVEAARIAKALGVPIKVVWTRQEEFTFAYFRPAGVNEVYAAVKADGTLVAWECDNYNSGPPGIVTPYNITSPRTASHQAPAPLRQGSYRCLGATFNNFARETHMDQLAHKLGMDPLAFRLKNIADPRLREVLSTAAEKFGWGKSKAQAGHGFGLACGTEKGSYIAACVEVSVDVETKDIRVLRAVNAFECGAILNPDLLRNQVEGAVIMGLGGALFEAIEFDDGKILNPHLARYRVPRYTDIPQMETILIDHKEQPSAGAGEAPILAIAPAIGNAIFAATSTRLRTMPLRLPA